MCDPLCNGPANPSNSAVTLHARSLGLVAGLSFVFADRNFTERPRYSVVYFNLDRYSGPSFSFMSKLTWCMHSIKIYFILMFTTYLDCAQFIQYSNTFKQSIVRTFSARKELL